LSEIEERAAGQTAPWCDSKATRNRARPRVRIIGDRRIIAEGLESNVWKDIYFNAMTASWPAFIASLAVAFVAVNFVFATLYALGSGAVANARQGSFPDLFFVSVETIATLGYCEMYPQTTYGHLVSATESFTGLVLLAVMTGFVFARISRPRARLLSPDIRSSRLTTVCQPFPFASPTRAATSSAKPPRSYG